MQQKDHGDIHRPGFPLENIQPCNGNCAMMHHDEGPLSCFWQ
jgi:hypothetical protein